MALSYNPYWAALRRSKDLHKYLAPGAGKMLAQHDLENIGVDKDLPQHFKDYYRFVTVFILNKKEINFMSYIGNGK